VVAKAGILMISLVGCLSAGDGSRRAVVADGPVEAQRHGPVHMQRHGLVVGYKVGCLEGVVALLYDEGIVAGAELLVGVRPARYGHAGIRDAWRDVDAAAAEARAGIITGVRFVIGDGDASRVVLVTEAAVVHPDAIGVGIGVAAEDEELIRCVGDAIYALSVEVDVARVAPSDVSGGVEAPPCHRKNHPSHREWRHGQVQHPDVLVGRR